MIGIRIAALRKSRGMSQKALGDKLHVTQGAVSQWENERTLPDTQQQRAIASFFDVSLDYLTGLSNDPKAISQSYSVSASMDMSASSAEDQEIWALRESLRRDPDRKMLFDAAANVPAEDILTAVRILDVFKAGKKSNS